MLDHADIPVFATVTELVKPVGTLTANDCETVAGREHVCRVKVSMSFSNNGTCLASITDEVHTKRKHRVVEWYIDKANLGLDGTTVDPNAPQFEFAQFDSIPAVSLYNDGSFARWTYRRKDRFVWRTAGKGPANYFVIVVGRTQPASASGFCAIVDPIITNDDDDL